MKTPLQLQIELCFKTTELGGRTGWVDLTSCRYRPHLVVDSGEYLGVCFVNSSPARARPGDAVIATVLLVYPGVDYSALVPGAEFKVIEGINTVAIGKVLGQQEPG